MDLKLFGFKFNILNAAIFLVLGFIISTLTVCSCAKVNSVKEAMDVIKGDKKESTKKEKDGLNKNMSDQVHPSEMHLDLNAVDMDKKIPVNFF